MRILLKCPTRSRPHKAMSTLKAYITLANNPSDIGVALSCDTDDASMTRNLVQEEILSLLKPVAWKRIFFGNNKSKIEACNANMAEIDWPWDIVVLVSDDMVAKVKGWDDVIRTHMVANFPDTDGILWFNDGHQGSLLNTLSIYGRVMYTSLGHIYNPKYKSFYCDTEITDSCQGPLASKTLYIPHSIIVHEHPGITREPADALYETNQTHFIADMDMYIAQRKYAYDWSILIPTMSGRESKLLGLLTSIREKMTRLAPTLRYEIYLRYDHRTETIGSKRQYMTWTAKGKYSSFIDDDDDITDAYIEDVVQCIQGNYDTMQFRGKIGAYEFVHSIQTKLSDFMATRTSPPVFVRPPNHLNPMKTDIMKLVSFANVSQFEDTMWCYKMVKTGLLRTEYCSATPRTQYVYNTRNDVDVETIRRQQAMTHKEFDGWLTPQSLTPTERPKAEPKELRFTARGFVSS